jgi:hypothetical protein
MPVLSHTLLADTPITILPMLVLFFSAIASPVIVIWSLVLAVRKSSRGFGLLVIGAELLGAVVCCVVWSLLAVLVRAPLSTLDAGTWFGLCAGGFGFFGAIALIAGYASGLGRA